MTAENTTTNNVVN